MSPSKRKLGRGAAHANESDARSGRRVMRTVLSGCLVAAALLFSAASAQARNLVVYNESTTAVHCAETAPVESPTRAIDVPAGSQGAVAAGAAGIDEVLCGGLRLTHLDVRTDAQGADDRIVVLNGRQQRTLRVTLFPYLPSSPAGDLSRLTRALEERFQQHFPDVALQLVMSTDIDPYNFDAFPQTFGPNGYDVVEVDTSVLSTLIGNRYIIPVTPVGDAPLDFAAKAVAAPNGRQWGLPTWICRDFIFSRDPGLSRVNSVASLLAYWKTLAVPMKVVADFDGRFQIYSMYLNAYVARHGYGDDQVQRALTGTIDPAAVADLVSIANGCAAADGGKPCIDGKFHNGQDGAMERLFAVGTSGGDVGYSERSFYFELGNNNRRFAVIPMPYGPSPVNLMYVDALVENKARCASNPCAADAASFGEFLNSAETRSFIAFADDLSPVDASVPPRHLLPATRSFYKIPRVTADPVYAAIIPVLASARPMPTTIEKAMLKDLDGRICAALKTGLPTYACTAPTSQGTSQ